MSQKKHNRIKAVIAERDKSSLWLAKELGVNKTTVSKWCTNEIQPRIDMLSRIAGALDVDIRELLVKTKS
jgi:transcriptional regulator with XRE-family HTH domain